ncbi:MULTISPECIES: efflux RND transporter periplasmic adaptor subunit [Cupriavidus]|uniref:Efflux RND transporter periplasmic adaptor subunit n=1 Tax=Cupriavidus pauculus TaxID=82633 RepID=A0A5P2HBA2_9BURK|nr:efflux RND transporter periplasmic adaptor subunit [Cupriavidus pauculus]QET04529.1 efflux RND transporter periplasmic adaptor subunit [Cupriavidus pauculus]
MKIPPLLQRPATLFALFALLVAGLWWWLLRPTEIVDTVPVTRGDIESSVTALGILQPRSYVDVGAQASGAIRRIHVQPGDAVTRGQLLVEIDPSVQQARVDATRATLASLRAQLAEQYAQRDLARQQAERQRSMARDGSTRDEDVQTAEAALRVALARIDNLRAQIDGASSQLKGDEAQLGYTRIFAPIAGTVVTLDAREGQTLNATYQTPTILRIADLSAMTVWTEVSEADVRRVRPGMSVYFTTLGVQDGEGAARRWTGKVRQILPAPPTPAGPAPAAGAAAAASPAGKVVLYTVLFDVDNGDRALMPQMSAQVFFVAASVSNVLVAPLPALQPVNGQPGRYTARVLGADGRIADRQVATGVRDRLSAEVVSGLKEGERLVTGVRYERMADGRFRW